MEEKRIIWMEKTNWKNKPANNTFACLSCPLGNFEHGYSGKFIALAKNEYTEKKEKYNQDKKDLHRLQTNGSTYFAMNVSRDLSEEQIKELSEKERQQLENRISEYEQNSQKTFEEFLDLCNYDVLNCYCTKKFQYTFMSDCEKYNHILTCDFKDGVVNEVSEMIAGQIKE